MGQGLAVLGIEIEGIEQITRDVELELPGRVVPDSDRARASVALQVSEAGSPKSPGVRRSRRGRRKPSSIWQCSARKEMNWTASSVIPHPQERVDGERGVANPRVPVVPVAITADALGETAGGRRHDGARRPERQQFQRQRGSLDHLPPAALVPASDDPVLPETQSAPELALADFLELLQWRRRLLVGLRENDRNLVAFAKKELRDDGAPVDPGLQRRDEIDREIARREAESRIRFSESGSPGVRSRRPAGIRGGRGSRHARRGPSGPPDGRLDVSVRRRRGWA